MVMVRGLSVAEIVLVMFVVARHVNSRVYSGEGKARLMRISGTSTINC